MEKKSNYDTRIFQATIAETGSLSGKKYGDDPKADVAMRVIADHSGLLPSRLPTGSFRQTIRPVT
jgi:alanyl-tRNA synthetase